MTKPVFENAFASQNRTSPLHRQSNQFRSQTDAMLREMAYVLQLTRLVKDQIMADKEEAVEV